MAAYRRVYDLRHLLADCQEPGSASEPYARQSSMGYLLPFLTFGPVTFGTSEPSPKNSLVGDDQVWRPHVGCRNAYTGDVAVSRRIPRQVFVLPFLANTHEQPSQSRGEFRATLEGLVEGPTKNLGRRMKCGEGV